MDIYNKLQEYDLKYIANMIYIDNFADSDVTRENYDNFINGKINEVFTMDEVIDTGSDNRKYIFAHPTTAYTTKTQYNNEDGYRKWGVIEFDNYMYKIVESKDYKGNERFNKTRDVKVRMDAAAL